MQNKNGTAPERPNRMHLTPRNRIKWRFCLPYSTENKVGIKMRNYGVIGREKNHHTPDSSEACGHLRIKNSNIFTMKFSSRHSVFFNIETF